MSLILATFTSSSDSNFARSDISLKENELGGADPNSNGLHYCVRENEGKILWFLGRLKRENASKRSSDGQLFLIDNTKYMSFRCVSKQSFITKSHRREKVIDNIWSRVSTTLALEFVDLSYRMRIKQYLTGGSPCRISTGKCSAAP